MFYVLRVSMIEVHDEIESKPALNDFVLKNATVCCQPVVTLHAIKCVFERGFIFPPVCGTGYRHKLLKCWPQIGMNIPV